MWGDPGELPLSISHQSPSGWASTRRGPLPSRSHHPLALPCPSPVPLTHFGTFLSPRTLSPEGPLCLSSDKHRLSAHLLATGLFMFLGLFS